MKWIENGLAFTNDYFSFGFFSVIPIVFALTKQYWLVSF